jgi:hypothetical protein
MLVAFATAGCSTSQAVTQGRSTGSRILQADKVAAATCSKAGEGTTVATAILAGYAVDQLRAARMNTEPWQNLSPSSIVFMCYRMIPTNGMEPLWNGVYLSSSGMVTTAPPLNQGNLCNHTGTTSTCSGSASQVGG